MPSVSAHVAHAIASHARHVFGVMGNGNAHFIDAVEARTDIAYTPVRHEAGGVAAADAHFRAGGGIAVATATYGAGFTNMITPLAESVQASVPLVLVIGDAPTTGARPWDVRQRDIADAVGAPTYTVGVTDPAQTVHRAVADARVLRRPVVVAIPYDIGAQEAGPLREHTGEPIDARVHEPGAGYAELRDALAASRRPLLLAGRGAWLAGAAEPLSSLADTLGAVTASTALARGIFARREHDLGVAGGFGAEPAMALVAEADVAVVFGASLNQFTMRFGGLFGPDTRVFQVDTAPAATHSRVDVHVRADAARAAHRLTRDLPARPVRDHWRTQVDVAALRVHDDGPEFADDRRLDPRAAARRIGRLLPDDRVVVSDGGHFIGWANMYWPVASPDRMMMVGTAYQSIGLGIPSMIGAARARATATVVLTSGDGGALMALADLESAVRVCGGLGCAVIWNDAAYSAEVTLYGAKGLAPGPMLIPETDFAALARALNAEGVVVRSLDDLEALREWAARDPRERPFLLLDLRVSGTVVAPYQHEIIRVNS
ncbi:MAG: thiamine pyrophosphate-binding protein [Leifsonia sp.]|uniref:thiamine pyrophosphate-binding protein n=1 Tax=Leifsonia sp. TaxID=1870902 RepID=UPI003F7E5FB5